MRRDWAINVNVFTSHRVRMGRRKYVIKEIQECSHLPPVEKTPQGVGHDTSSTFTAQPWSAFFCEVGTDGPIFSHRTQASFIYCAQLLKHDVSIRIRIIMVVLMLRPIQQGSVISTPQKQAEELY